MSVDSVAGGVDPRPAATLVILRDSAAGLEVLLTKRPDAMRFMGGATVFPGGAVGAGDRDPRWRKLSPVTPADAATVLDLDEAKALPHFIAALREAFEEVRFPPWGRLGRAMRADDDAESFLDRCIGAGRVATDELVSFGRWVTPLGAPVRFDTRFFACRAPDSWEPEPDPREVSAAWWATPHAALGTLADGGSIMAPPTVETLQRLAAHDSVADALASSPGPRETYSTRLSPLVGVVLAPNPGLLTGPGTNCYVVGAAIGTVVIDPGVEDEDFLGAVLRVAGRIDRIVVTHRHPDHTGGAARLASTSGALVHAFGEGAAGSSEVVPIRDGDDLGPDGVALVAVHTPGHSSDHICLHLPFAASLFSGDAILGEGTSVIAPPDGDMRAYMTSLERLRRLDVDRIYPGHFRPLDGGRRVIDELVTHRLQREGLILDALPGDLETIVARAYSDTPRELHGVAAWSARAHLDKLTAERRVAYDGSTWTLLEGTR